VATDTDIVISTEEIRVGDQIFATDKVEYLDFWSMAMRGCKAPGSGGGG